MLLYFGSITILPEANECLCDTGHIWPGYEQTLVLCSDQHCGGGA